MARRKGYRTKKGKGRKAKRGKRRGKAKGKRKMLPGLSLMIKETVPQDFIYNFTLMHQVTMGTGGLSMWCNLMSWNDAWDIAWMHNQLRTQLGVTTGCLNKFAVGRFKGVYQIKNTSNNDVRLDFYKVIARQDGDATIYPNKSWTGTSATQYYTWWNLVVAGWLEQTTAGGSGQTLTNFQVPLGISPYKVNKFCSYLKIVSKKLNVSLLGGGTKSIAVSDPKWRYWDGSKVVGCNGQGSSVSDVVFGRRTGWLFCVVTPSVVSTDQGPTVGPFQIIYSGRECYQYTGTVQTQKVSYAPIVDMPLTYSDLNTVTEKTELNVSYVVSDSNTNPMQDSTISPAIRSSPDDTKYVLVS